MIQIKEHLPQEWFDFIEQIKILNPIDEETVKQFVKVRVSQFPSDQQMKEYYEEVFSKSTNDQNRKKWHLQDKILLIWCMTKYLMSQNRSDLIPNDRDWEYISKILWVDKQLLELKWISLLHSNLKISVWTKEEDQILTDIARLYSQNNWTELTIKFNQQSQSQRYPKQIRERWNNVLNPNISKQTWTKEEKIELIQLILDYGKKWSKIQNLMNGRSESQIKNQYNGIIRNLKRFNVQPTEERSLLNAIIKNPDQKLSLTVTQFMSDFLAKKEMSKKMDTPLLDTRKDEGSNFKKTKAELHPLDNAISALNISINEKSKISQESQHQIPQTPNLFQLQNSNLSIPQIQPQQMYYGNQYYMSCFPNNYMNYSPINQAYPNYYQFPMNLGFQQYPGYF